MLDKDKKKKDEIIEAQEVKEEKSLVATQPNDLHKPQQDTEFAHASAKLLVDIVRKNGWARKLGGQSEHLQYEAWQTVGKYYGYTVKTHDAEYVRIDNTWGFKAKATVVNENTGVIVGGAEAYCMSDEGNWSRKPKFQLASMAQTRAGSKALRQILGFVVALAGYNPTPMEEITGDESSSGGSGRSGPLTPHQMAQKKEEGDSTREPYYDTSNRSTRPSRPIVTTKQEPPTPAMITQEQKEKIFILPGKAGKTRPDILKGIKERFKKDSVDSLTEFEAQAVINSLEKLVKEKETDQEAEQLAADVDAGLAGARV